MKTCTKNTLNNCFRFLAKLKVDQLFMLITTMETMGQSNR